MEPGADLVDRRRDFTRSREIASRRNRVARGINEHILLLHYSVYPLCLQNLFRLEAIEKDPKSATNHHLRRSAPAAHAPGKSEAWRPVAAIMNVVLRLEAQTIAERNIWPHLQ